MMLCPQCQGVGDTMQGSYGATPTGTDQDMCFAYPSVQTVYPISCTGCAGTGKYQSFGSSGSF